MIASMEAVSRGFRGRALAIAGALSLLLAGIALHSARGDVPSPEYSPEQLVLRLHDLPPGYCPFDSSEGAGRDFICEPLQPGEPGRRLKRFVERFSPAGCFGVYLRAYRVPGVGPTSAVVGTGAMEVGSDAAATLGFTLAAQLLHRLVNDSPLEEVAPPETIGTATRLFHWKDAPRIFHSGPRASFVAWRSGTVLAATYATASSLAASDRIALDLARRQQAHIENRTPYTEAERDDTEVELDDPNLQIPVYWLGRMFEPGNGFPATELETATVVEKGGLPGAKLELRYSGFNLETWTRESWKRFQGSILGKLNRPRCTRTTPFEWEQGHAVISAGYQRRTFEAGCPDYLPTRYWAAAYVGGVVIGVNQTTCRCLSPGSGPYSESLRGMKAVIRGLQLRPKPVYPAARR